MISSQNFNPRTPRGARRKNAAHDKFFLYFNPRAPCGARQHLAIWTISSPEFQSTRPSRGATARSDLIQRLGDISIHAPLAGRDGGRSDRHTHQQHFNPRAPRRARPKSMRYVQPAALFQSTRPYGRDDPNRAQGSFRPNFNPRAPRGARRRQVQSHALCRCISIHTPLAGRDGKWEFNLCLQCGFQSTRPSRGATLRP